MFKIILAYIFTISSAFAGAPPVSVKGQNGTKLIPKWNLQFPSQTVDNLGGIDAYIATGNTNILVDGDVQKLTTSDWGTGANTTLSKNTTSPLYGARHLRAVLSGTAADDVMMWQPNAIPLGLVSTNLEITVFIRTSNSGIIFCPIISASYACSSNIAVIGDGVWRKYTANVTTSDVTANLAVRVNRTVATGTTATVDIALPYIGLARNISTGIPPNTFTAYASSTGVVSAETGGDFINGNCAVTDTSLFTCTWNSGFFTAAPNCVVTVDNSSTTETTIAKTNSVSSSSVVVRTGNSTTASSFSKAAYFFSLSCTKTGADYVQSAISQNNYNFTGTPWGAYTTQGMGTVTNPTNSYDCTYSRVERFLLADCRIVLGTVAASQAQFGLPTGLTIDSTIVPTGKFAGTWYRNNGSINTQKFGAVIAPSGAASYVQFSYTDYTTANNPFTAQNGSTLWTNSDTISFQFRVPITQWSNTQNAPQLLGSVTSNSNNAEKTCSAKVIYTAGTPSISKQDSCFSTTVGDVGTGYATFTFATAYGDVPICTCTVVDSAATTCTLADILAGTMAVKVVNFSAAGVDANFNIMCKGPR